MKGVEIIDKVGVLVRTVQRIVKQFKEDGNFKSHTSPWRPNYLVRKMFGILYSSWDPIVEHHLLRSPMHALC